MCKPEYQNWLFYFRKFIHKKWIINFWFSSHTMFHSENSIPLCLLSYLVRTKWNSRVGWCARARLFIEFSPKKKNYRRHQTQIYSISFRMRRRTIFFSSLITKHNMWCFTLCLNFNAQNIELIRIKQSFSPSLLCLQPLILLH